MARYLRRKSIHKKRIRKLGAIERDVLGELTLGDMLYSFLLSGRSTKQFYRLARERANHRHRRKLAIERLVEHEFISTRGDRLSITEHGRSALDDRVARTFDLLKTVAWDGKWRIVAFDIPERYSVLRNKVREILKRAGFQKLQHSVWIFPHECAELSLLIQEESGLKKHILYGVLDRIENEERLKGLFRL